MEPVTPVTEVTDKQMTTALQGFASLIKKHGGSLVLTREEFENVRGEFHVGFRRRDDSVLFYIIEGADDEDAGRTTN
jgi:hypothetical protein